MYAVFARPVVWHGLVRAVVFLGLTAASGMLLARLVPFSDIGILADVYHEMTQGNYERVSDRNFAFALASLVVQVAGALAIAFFLAHVLLIRLALAHARRVLKRTGDTRAVAEAYDTLRERLERNALIGSAWGEFAETLVVEPRAVRNTIRPQSFINVGVARERLYGLKLMSSIPGYFVGLGLLLTFIGLVFALNKAAGSTGAGSAEEMTRSLGELLSAATFKFGTSIAGLGSSLALALLFKSYAIWIETGFDGFCRDLEDRLVFYPPQAIAAETKTILEAQRDQLKEINSERFFTRLGDSVAPSVQAAMAAAVQPMTESLNEAVGQLTQTSQTGLEEMLRRFQDNLQGSAGAELKQLAGTLNAMQGALEGVQRNLAGSGQDFSRQLSDAAANLDRLVSQAGANLGASADTSRALLEDVAQQLRATFEMANRQVEENLAASTRGAAGLIEESMGRVLGKLEAQTGEFGRVIGAFQSALTAQAEGSARTAQAISESATGATRQAAQDAATAMRGAIGEVSASVTGAAAQAEQVMAQMATRLDTQMASLVEVVGTLQRTVASQAEESARAARESSAAASASATHSAQEAARAMQGTVDQVASSVTGAATQAEQVMAQMTAQLHTQLAAFSDTVATLQKSAAAQAEESARAAREASAAAAASAAQAAREAAETMRATMTGIVIEMRGSVETLSATLRTVETAFAGQVRQVDSVSARSRETADVFGQVARSIQGASQPLVHTSERIAGAAESMAGSVHEAAGALRAGQEAAAALAERLQLHLDRAGQSIAAYEERFAHVDEELGRAVGRFAEQVKQQQDRIGEFVTEIDRHLSATTDKLATMIDELAHSNQELGTALSGLTRPIQLAAAE
ncbi:anti-phage ZorAB system protein ZorA [Methylorubrum extorquens]